MPPKKRGRKPKPKNEKDSKKGPPKKRGRKPKGGKIINKNQKKNVNTNYTPNIILHLKTSNKELEVKNNITNIDYDPNINEPEAFNINTIKNQYFQIEELKDENKKIKKNKKQSNDSKSKKNDNKELWEKLNNLKKNLNSKNISDKSSNCFWCTCYFDNPAIYIPKNIFEEKIEVYGCFCSPECALSYLKNENIDTSTLWERYSLLNNLYGKIYNYEKNIKPAPCPYYTLDKYYGNLSIQQYRKLLTNDRLIMIVDKPLSKVLPEIYEENNEEPNIINNILNEKKNSSKNYKLKSKEVFKTKTAILKDSFNVF
jgi:hypothetical protein